MNKIMVVALGPGHPKYLLTAAKERLEETEVLIGSQRQIEEVKKLIQAKTKICIYTKIIEIRELLEAAEGREVSILVSGDSGYYSLVPYLKRSLGKDFGIIPGLSSYQYLFSKLGENWQDYLLGSVHGRDFDYCQRMAEEHKGLILLTDAKKHPRELAKDLYEAGYRGVEVIVGENLSYDWERISHYAIEDWKLMPEDYEMNVCVLKKGGKYALLR